MGWFEIAMHDTRAVRGGQTGRDLSCDMELIRSRGQFPKGGYDVHDGEWQPASPATVQ